jgi:hypothetical protein
MITVKDLTDRDFKHEKIINHEPFITHVYKNGDITIEMDYTDEHLVGVDIIIPSIIIRNFSPERLDLLMGVVSPEEGELISILD